MVKSRFDIFLGGPMDDLREDGAILPGRPQLTFADHFDNLRSAVKSIVDELNNDPDILQAIFISDPVIDEFGDIPDTIFNMLNFAELGVLDISANSPSVMYELTFLHALGVPVLPIVLKHQFDENKVPFYLQQNYLAIVDDFQVETLANALRPKIRASLSPTIFGADRYSNPITKFYRMPLAEASATTGLATGYFHNFVRHVIKETNSVFQFAPDLKEMVFLIPSKFQDLSSMKMDIERRINELGLKFEWVREDDGGIYEEEDHVRGAIYLMKVGNYIIDFPAPLNALKSSPKFIRISELIRDYMGPGQETAQLLMEQLETNMIQRFTDHLKHLKTTTSNIAPDRLQFRTPDEFLEILASEINEQ